MNQIEFDPLRAKPYRKRNRIHAYPVPHAVTYRPAWAGRKGQVFRGPHMAVVNLDPETGRPVELYGCALVEFYNTYERVSGCDVWVHRKTTMVLAYPTEVAGIVVVRTSEGVEAVGQIDAGDWIVRNPSGDTYCWSADKAKHYEAVNGQP